VEDSGRLDLKECVGGFILAFCWTRARCPRA
jgi:hypothetical protein